MMQKPDYAFCRLCPRQCCVDRTAGAVGFCGSPDRAVVAKTMLHQWEEPVLAPGGRSGAIFFGGCTLGCRYCQNRAISTVPAGTLADAPQLRQMMLALIGQGAENIDLVTPTHFLPTVIQALEEKLPVPVVYNCGGYERPEMIEALAGKVDIFLPDLKYAHNALAARLSGAGNYVQYATAAIRQMVQVAGPVRMEGDKMTGGVIIRHLVLPGQVENSLKVLDWIGENFRPGEVLVSLMGQYTPMPGMQPPMDRRVTQEEYDAVLSWMYLNGLQGFAQELSAADGDFIPDFSGSDEILPKKL